MHLHRGRKHLTFCLISAKWFKGNMESANHIVSGASKLGKMNRGMVSIRISLSLYLSYAEYLYPMLKPFYPKDNTPSTEHKDSMNGMMRMKTMLICSGLFSQQISTQLNTYKRFWTYMLHSTLHCHHQNTSLGKIF